LSNPAAHNIVAPAPAVIRSYFARTGTIKMRVLYHILFWICYIMFINLMFFGLTRIENPTFYLQLLLFFPLEMVLVYFNFYFLMPRLLFARKYVLYGASLFIGVMMVAMVNVLIHFLYVRLGYITFITGANFSALNIMSRAMEIIYLIGFTSGVKLARNWMSHLQWIQEKEKQYLETELNFLKTQIQPHFFFNTLNNLYSLTLKKSDLAPEVVLKLSDLMSYMLYESGAGRVALDKEIAYLQNYIDVEKLRFGQRLDVSFETQGNTETVSIAPMILILFLENSFKHGVKNNVHHIYIRISLKVEDGWIYFQVINPLSTEDAKRAHEGIGLKNVRRRLELLFGKNYTLNTEEMDKQYIVSLKMPVW
jgi:two-component system, LytTR family, sensor kinase